MYVSRCACHVQNLLVLPRPMHRCGLTDTDRVNVKILDRLQPSWQLGRDRDSFDHLRVVEQLLD